ncbi:MAG TPA: TonB family protein [Gemmatimonadaceae bacterium]
MFNNLIESQAKKQKTTGGTVFSIVFHAVLIVLAVEGTLQAKSKYEKAKEQKVEFVQVKKEEPPPPKEEKPPPPDIVVAPPPPKGFQILSAPIKIPDVIPEIDLNKQATREEDFTGKGVAGGRSNGVVGGVAAPLNSDQPLFDFQVEKPAASNPSNQPPSYPNQLRAANIEGQVVAKFVVDTTGRADMKTFEIVKSDHELFTSAVRNVLPNYRFFPAELGGKKVKQLVQMPFVFTLNK